MTSIIKLTSNVRAILDWEEIDTDEGISIQTDLGEPTEELVFTYGSGAGQINEAWYQEFTIGSGSNQIIDLSALPATLFNISITKEIDTLKALLVENLSSSGNLLIGSSGATEPVRFLGELCDIGYSGVYEMISQVGIDVNSSRHTFNIINNNVFDVTFKVLVLGVDL